MKCKNLLKTRPDNMDYVTLTVEKKLGYADCFNQPHTHIPEESTAT